MALLVLEQPPLESQGGVTGWPKQMPWPGVSSSLLSWAKASFMLRFSNG